jgi:RHS repeat-associated protein
MSHRTLFYYDQESNVTCVRDADNGLTYFTYDLLNRMTSVKNPFDEVTYYEYTPSGQVKKRTLGNGTLTYYEHDDVGRVSKVDNRKSDLSVISTFEYEHDKVGNPTKITREDGSVTYYQYDKIYQLTGETQVDSQGQVEYAFEYQYDKAHNRTVKVDNGTATYYTHNEANELLTETTNGQTTYYQYDRCGNTTAKQEPSGATYYQYDTENLLTRIDFADGSHNYFGYDGDSKRVSARTSEGFTEFIYQGPDMLKLLLERDDQGVTQAHYTMGAGLEAMRRNTSSGIAAGASSFYHYNHLGTTHELTDASQTITDTYRHDAWGVLLAQTGSTVNPHTYVGRQRYYWMVGAGLYHLGLRDYRPRVGRFIAVDPGREGQVWYLYLLNAPSSAADPLGPAGGGGGGGAWAEGSEGAGGVERKCCLWDSIDAIRKRKLQLEATWERFVKGGPGSEYATGRSPYMRCYPGANDGGAPGRPYIFIHPDFRDACVRACVILHEEIHGNQCIVWGKCQLDAWQKKHGTRVTMIESPAWQAELRCLQREIRLYERDPSHCWTYVDPYNPGNWYRTDVWLQAATQVKKEFVEICAKGT